jgi:D-3-phosphoglycerate dehydrogenase
LSNESRVRVLREVSLERKRVVVSEYIDPAGLDILRGGTEVLYLPLAPGISLADAVADAHGLGVRLARVTQELIDAAPHLKVVAKHGVGYDNIDVAAATRRGIVVVTTPKANSVSVSEHIVALMLGLANRVCAADSDLKAGRYRKREDYIGVELKGKTLGVVGIGRIGSETVLKCRLGFGMSVVAYDPYVPSERFEALGCERSGDLERVVREADFLALCVPLTAETRGMLGARELALMKPTSYLVNTSRGGIVDEEALYRALVAGGLAGAGMDVFVNEPPAADHPLLSLSNFVATPHVAGATVEAMRRMATDLADEILRVLHGERPLYPVNPEVYE